MGKKWPAPLKCIAFFFFQTKGFWIQASITVQQINVAYNQYFKQCKNFHNNLYTVWSPNIHCMICLWLVVWSQCHSGGRITWSWIHSGDEIIHTRLCLCLQSYLSSNFLVFCKPESVFLIHLLLSIMASKSTSTQGKRQKKSLVL